MKPEYQVFVVRSTAAPRIAIDPEVDAVYVYFKRSKVARTVPRECRKMILNVDLDGNGDVVGIEAIGAGQLEISKLLDRAHVRAPKVDWSRTRFGRRHEMATA